ncbi:hypothetical protein [uncultured Winogradskyella sp.]|uniref:hypothetical protein n=1 Tax=uncultured Winogradskyella sp. TaxID=395353 RepID=UPI0030DD778A|tara:strand:- start:7692 stop:7988 length:297 start_codon:yes stop_codon:yes gene_type:complete
MNKRKRKLFLKIFFILVIVQLIIGFTDILLTSAASSLSSITSFMLTIFSFPIGLISRNLPFYSGEGIYVTLLFWALNLILQTIAVYVFFRLVKRVKTN